MMRVKEIEKKGFDLEQGAAYLSVSTWFLRKRIDTGEIPSHKLGDLVRIAKDDLDAYFEKCKRK